ncbi:armadillo-type protein [Neurospora hispaniola]|uniref:Armadillo-type protein n=1 Tax=Neurospora hispaniola TaxID=588809 RepID=A0AAJ0MSP2_9PEZI|nr:armadillo-type protein [Neurospora hispaniola]
MATTTTATPGPRNEFFKQLRTVCVPLSRLALQSPDKAAAAKEIFTHVESLSEIWAAQVSSDPTVLDEKLAEYTFFPVSHLLRFHDQFPVRVVEAIIKLLRFLIQYGWKQKISEDLAVQLLFFFSFTISGTPGQAKKRHAPEETAVEGFKALGALITAIGPTSLLASKAPGEENETVTALGPAITVTLDGITDGVAPTVQLEALECLQAVYTTTRNQHVLARFLPGTVSSLTRVLAPPLQPKTQRRVLVRCLQVLGIVLVNVLSDIKIRGILKQIEMEDKAKVDDAQPSGGAEKPQTELTPAWLRATTAQIKIALAAALKVRTHEAPDVQSAVSKFCISLLDECHLSLANCQSILVESAMMVENEENERSMLETSLQDLAAIHPELGDCIQATLYNWVISLPRLIESNDERIKQLAVRNILRGSKMASAMGIDSSTLNDSLGDSLRDSIVALVKGSRPSKVVGDVDENSLSTATDLTVSRPNIQLYPPVLLDSEGIKSTRAEITKLIANIGSPAQQTKLAAAMLGGLRDSEGVEQIASYWLAFELLKTTYNSTSDMEDLVDMSSLDENRYQEQVFQELYDFSASILASHSDSQDNDWRVEAIALEVTAFAASRMKEDFRPELIDVLYPVTTFLGSPTPQLRSHAITTLNVIAASCGYKNVSELVVDNADYMVNSISLRLNTFDISPASTKVLVMLIRLTGPRLIPFLDDVVAAIFAALDNYHGYPVFVESLFSVLSEIVTQGVKSDMLLLEGSNPQAVSHLKRGPQPLDIDYIVDTLNKRAERTKRAREEEAEPPQPHPKKPWGPGKTEEDSQAKSLLDQLENPDPEEGGEKDGGLPDDPSSALATREDEEKKNQPSNTPTYALLTRVLTLSQHYLTSPTPTLRKSLLDLVATVSPALAPDENAFLPLVHTVWPVVVARIKDPEPFVAIAACKALGSMCEAAGDFMASRFKQEWGDGMAKWLRGIKKEAVKGREMPKRTGTGAGRAFITGGKKVDDMEIVLPIHGPNGGHQLSSKQLVSTTSSTGGGALGRFSQAHQLWDAALGLVTAILKYVRVDDEMFDEILEVVVDVLHEPERRELKEALETINADAVWLALHERGKVKGIKSMPRAVKGFGFEFVRVPGVVA